MRTLIPILIFLTLTNCKFHPSNDFKIPRHGSTDSIALKDDFKVRELRDTIRIDFRTKTDNYSTGLLDSITNLITKKGFFKPEIDRNGKIRFHRENSRTLKVAYDSADMHVFIDNDYLLNNISITSIAFDGKRSSRNPEYKPGFLLEEWWFNNNADRDSALKWINYVFGHPKSIVMYEKSYPQIITASNRLIILTTDFDIWEEYALEYKHIIESFLSNDR